MTQARISKAIEYFWDHLQRMTADDWRSVGEAASFVGKADKQWDELQEAAIVAGNFARNSGHVSGLVSDEPAISGSERLAYLLSCDLFDGNGRGCAHEAMLAACEIVGEAGFRKNGVGFTFLPMFGFSDPDELIASRTQVAA